MSQCVVMALVLIVIWLLIAFWMVGFNNKKQGASAWTSPYCMNLCSKYNPSKHWSQYMQCMDQCATYERCITNCDDNCKSPSCQTQQCYLGCGSA